MPGTYLGPTPAVVGCPVVRFQAYRLTQIEDRPVIVTPPRISFGAIAKTLSVIGSQADRLIKVLNGAVELLLLHGDEASIIERFGVARIQIYRLIEIVGSAVVILLFGIDTTTTEKRTGIARIQVNRVIIVPNCAVVVMLPCVYPRATLKRVLEIRV